MKKTIINKTTNGLFSVLFVILVFIAVNFTISNIAFAGSDGFGKVLTGDIEPTFQCVGDGCSSGSGGSSGDYSTSWIYYETVLPEGQQMEVQFRPDITRNNWPQASRNLSIPAECSQTINGEKGGFWHFGRNYRAYNHSGYAIFGNFMFVHGFSGQLPSVDTYTYSSADGRYGHAFTYSWGNGMRYLGAPNGTLSHSLYNGDTEVYRAVRYDLEPTEDDEPTEDYGGNPESAWYAFLASYKWEHNGRTYEEDHEDDYNDKKYPSDVWAFCYGDWMTQEYYTSSTVSVDDGETTITATTGPSNTWKEADVPEGYSEGNALEYSVGKTVTVTISHNIYAEELANGVRWKIDNANIVNYGAGDVSIKAGARGSGDSGVNLSVKNGSGLYVYDQNSDITSSTYTVKLVQPGEVIICETILIMDEDPLTGACARIRAVGSPDEEVVKYAAKSNVAIVGGEPEKNWTSTGIAWSYKAESVTENNIKKDTVRQIIFSHNVYASEAKDGVPVTITRDGFDGNEYSLVGDPTYCPAHWYNTTTVNFKEKSDDIYVGEDVNPDNQQRCTDADVGGFQYLAREIYEIKFVPKDTSKERKYEFCESITVGGEVKTRVCAVLNTGKDDPQIVTENNCPAWTPSNYPANGITSVVSFVKTEYNSSWLKSTYAKPSDLVSWIHCYYPAVQSKYDLQVSMLDPLHFSWSGGGVTNTMGYENISAHFPWSNGFSVSNSTNFDPNYNPRSSWSGEVGNTNVPDPIRSTYTVPGSKVNNTLTETNTSSYPSTASVSDLGQHSWTCASTTKYTSWVNSYSCSPKYKTEKVKNDKGEEVDVVTLVSSGCTGVSVTGITPSRVTLPSSPYVCGGWRQRCGGWSGGGNDEYGNFSGTASQYCSASNYCSVTCYHVGDPFGGTYRVGSLGGAVSSSASVLIPYNFRNAINVKINEDHVYAGEIATVKSLDIDVNTRSNSETNGTYATRVDEAKIKLVAYVSATTGGSRIESFGSGKSYNFCSDSAFVGYESCVELDSADGLTFNSAENYYGQKGESRALLFDKNEYSVFDTDAGKYFCVVAALYPANSGYDTNMSASGSNTWYVSNPDCKVIAKRPSFQVRGGSVYSTNTISTSTSNKNNIRGVYDYTPLNSGITVVFGSWGEQGVTSNGVVKGFASGAATGLTGSVEGSNPNYCSYRVPISFANYAPKIGFNMCPNTQQVGESEIGGSGIATSTVNKDALVNYWWVRDSIEVSGTNIDLANNYIETTNLQGDPIRFAYKSDSFSLVGATISAGTTYVVRSTGNITINGDIKYNDADYYTALKYVPKVIIYAQGNIYINCNVGRIDALLVSDGVIDTCVTSSSGANPGVNDSLRSKQLTITGVVVANKLKLNRTYGAGAGAASAIPAEIINYDTSAMLWGRRMAESDSFETLQTVYQHELAPRY